MLFSRATMYAHAVQLKAAAMSVLISSICLYADYLRCNPYRVAASLSVSTDIVIAVISVWTMKKIRTVYDTTQKYLRSLMFSRTCAQS